MEMIDIDLFPQILFPSDCDSLPILCCRLVNTLGSLTGRRVYTRLAGRNISVVDA